MKNVMVLLAIIGMVFVAGCQKAQDEAMEKAIEQNTGADVEVSDGGRKMTIKTDDGEVKIDQDIDTEKGEGTITMQTDDGEKKIDFKAGDEENWCQTGSEWKMSSTGQDAGNAQMMVKGIVESGKYAGYCHVAYDAQGAEGQMKMDYYYNEAGDGYQVINMNGQKFEQEIKGEN